MSKKQGKIRFSKFLFISLFIAFEAEAETVLPVFAGTWYETPPQYNLDTTSSCGEKKYLNDVKQYYSSPDEVYQKYSPPYASCKYNLSNQGYNYYVPITFLHLAPQPNTTWSEVQGKPDYPLPMFFNFSCLEPYIPGMGVSIDPVYICPKGSRYSAATYSCDTTPVPCDADVVARDLNFPGMSVFGHVGLSNREDHVLEVLNDDEEPIQENRMSDFVTESEYWGEKFGTIPYKDLTLNQSDSIMWEAWDQRSYDPEYTTGWDWQPGGDIDINHIYDADKKTWLKTEGVTTAKFRCDSFVYYCYKAGIGVDIVDYKMPDTPYTIYQALREERISLHGPNGRKAFSFERKSVQDVQRKSIDAVLAGNKIDYAEAWLAFNTYRENINIPRQEKIDYLWGLAQGYQQDKLRFDLLTEWLDAMKPIELAPQFIEYYQKQNDRHVKFKVLQIMADSLHIKQGPQPSNMSEAQIKNIVKVQNFYAEELQKNNDPMLLDKMMGFYVKMAPPEKAYQHIRNAYERLQEKNTDSTKALTYLSKYYLRLLSVAFETEQSKTSLLSEVLNEGQQLQGDKQKLFNIALCRSVSKQSLNTMSSEKKTTVKNLLLKNQKELMDQFYTKELKLPYCNWLAAYSNVVSERSDDRLKNMQDYVCASENVLLQAQLVPQLGAAPNHYTMLKQLDKNCVKRMQANLRQKMQTFDKHSKDMTIISSALTTLKAAE